MAHLHRASIVALCTCLAVSAVAAPASAGPTPEQIDEGRSHFNRGVEYYKENDFRGALVEFKRAYDIAPNWKVLYNLGYTSLELQDYAAALRYLERYLSDGGSDVPADKKAKVQQEIEKLQKRVARITIEVNVEGAEVLVDDVPIGKSPLSEAVLVSAGRRRIVVSKGGASQTRVVDLAGGDTNKVSIELEAPKVATGGGNVVTPPPVGGTTPPPQGSSKAGVWIGIGVTSALAIGTVVTGVLALSAKNKFDDTIARPGISATDVDDARSKTRTLALVTDILGAATIVSAAITVIVALTTGGSKAPPKDAPAPVSFQISPFGAAIAGTF